MCSKSVILSIKYIARMIFSIKNIFFKYLTQSKFSLYVFFDPFKYVKSVILYFKNRSVNFIATLLQTSSPHYTPENSKS